MPSARRSLNAAREHSEYPSEYSLNAVREYSVLLLFGSDRTADAPTQPRRTSASAFRLGPFTAYAGNRNVIAAKALPYNKPNYAAILLSGMSVPGVSRR